MAISNSGLPLGAGASVREQSQKGTRWVQCSSQRLLSSLLLSPNLLKGQLPPQGPAGSHSQHEEDNKQAAASHSRMGEKYQWECQFRREEEKTKVDYCHSFHRKASSKEPTVGSQKFSLRRRWSVAWLTINTCWAGTTERKGFPETISK